MKLEDKGVSLATNNREVVDALLKGSELDEALCYILRVVADVLDYSAGGSDAVAFFGGTTDHSSITFGYKIAGRKKVLYARDIEELGVAMGSLL